MPYSSHRDDGELFAHFHGDAVIDDFLGAMEDFGKLDEDRSTSHSILDLTDIVTADLTIDEMHRFAATVRMLFPRTRVHRFAVVAPTTVTRTLVRDYIEVRNVLAIRPADGPNEVAVFSEVHDARRWATRADEPPTPDEAWP